MHFILAVIAGLNAILTIWHVLGSRVLVSRGQYGKYSVVKYSYTGHDYPLQFPMDSQGVVAMTLQGSVRLALNLSDQVASDEWMSMLNVVDGYGRVRLGPERRLFVLTWYHQLHCLREIQVGLLDHSDPEATMHHLQHCFTYLRQTLLCDANSSLEDGDFMDRDYGANYVGSSLVCQDWENIQMLASANFGEFQRWREEWL